MSPSPTALHERLVTRLSYLFSEQIEAEECDCVVYTGLDWVVADDTVVRPDLMIVCGTQPEIHLQEPPSLIVEVLSPSTQLKDRTAKRALYEEQGVGFYLLADPATREVEGLELIDGKLSPIADLSRCTFTLSDRCKLRLDLDRLGS